MRIFFLLVCAALSFLPAAAGAQARAYSEPELEGLLAPIALYPDQVLYDVLNAAQTRDPVAQSAAVNSLAAYPELLASMRQSPQWTFDLGDAWLWQPADVMAAVQSLRQRAYAQGSLQSDPYQSVQYAGPSIVVLPATSYVYVRYYDPWVAYGPSWRPAYRPVYWRPWVSRPVYVNRVVVRQQPYHRMPESRRQPIVQSRVAHAFPVRGPELDSRRGAHPPRNAGADPRAGARLGAVRADRSRGAGPGVLSAQARAPERGHDRGRFR